MRVANPYTVSRFCSLYPVFPICFKYSAPSPSRLPRVLTLINISFFCSSASPKPKDPAEVFRGFGCSDTEISNLFNRRPSLLKANLTILSSKLTLLFGLGLTSTDLVKIINCRPGFLSCRFGRDFSERIEFLQHLFGPKEVFLKAIIRNPSLLTYDHNRMKHCVSLYEKLGVSKQDLIPLLISRPTLVPRSLLDDEKLDYIKRIGLSNNSKMYKYVVSLIAISRLDTIREKAMNLEKCGLSGDQVMNLFGRSPLVFTLSIDKVQRNMTFVIGNMKLPATVVLQHTFLLFSNLESVLKPRFVLGEKIKSMGLVPQIKGPNLLRALRMKEPRFLKAFIFCQSKNVSDDLLDLYEKAKGMKRLAETSRRVVHKDFPF